MATVVRWRRGTTAENDAFTGAEGEITVDMDKKGLRVHDNATQGGHPSLTEEAAHEAGYAYQVDSVSDLRSGSFPASLKRIWLAGYYGVGTAGSGLLYRDSDDTTTADNGGTVFVDADEVRWKRPLSSERDARDFGVRTTNTAEENGQALQSALAAMLGGSVLIEEEYETTPLDIDGSLSVRSSGAGALLSDGDYCLKVTTAVDFVTVKGLRFDFPHATETGGGHGTSSGRDAFTNITSSPGDTSFPSTDDSVDIARLVIEDCVFGFGRVTIGGEGTWPEVRRNKWSSSDIVTRPTYLYVAQAPEALIEHNSMDVPASDIHDLVKITGESTEASFLNNHIRNNNMSQNADVDVYSGGDKFVAIGNTFFNTYIQRKQTGSSDPDESVSVSWDKYIGNHFEREGSVTFTAVSGGITLRGSRFMVVNNTFKYNEGSENEASIYAVNLDNEVETYDDFDTISPKMWIIQGNMADYSEVEAPSEGEHRFISASSDSDGPVGVVSGNLLNGCERFINGGNDGNLSFVGNVWYGSDGESTVITGAAEAGNYFDGNGVLRGIENSVAVRGAGSGSNQISAASSLDASSFLSSYVLIQGEATVSTITGGVPGQEITLVQDGSGTPTTIEHGTGENNIRLSGSANYDMEFQDSLTIVLSHRGFWIETSRSEK